MSENGRGDGKIARMIQPQDFEGAFAMAERLCLSELIPKGFKPKLRANMNLEERQTAIEVSAASIVIAWEMGAELGLSAMTSLQSIAVINGKPNLYGETPLAVVMASGKLDYIKESLDEEKKVATCEVKRVGMDLVVTKTFSMKEADEAEMYELDAQGNGKWKKLSERATYRSFWRDMLMYRARGRALKALFADVLKGIEIQEASLETGAPEPGAGTIIDTVAEEVNPFGSQKKEPASVEEAAEPSNGGAADRPDEPAGRGERVPPVVGNPRQRRVRKGVDPGPPSESDPVGDASRIVADVAGGSSVPESGLHQSGASGGGDPAGESTSGSGAVSDKQQEDTLLEGARAVGGKPLRVPETGNAELPGMPKGSASSTLPAPPPGSDDCAAVNEAGQRCWGPKGHIPEGDHLFEPAAAPAVADGPQVFKVGDRMIETAGMTESQFRESLLLATAIDKDVRYRNPNKHPKGYARELLRRTLNVVDVEQATRKTLTKALAEKYLESLRMAAATGAPQQEIKS